MILWTIQTEPAWQGTVDFFLCMLPLMKLRVQARMERKNQESILIEALQLLTEKCPRLRKSCYWAGASAIALEELHHRQSFDLAFPLDFKTSFGFPACRSSKYYGGCEEVYLRSPENRPLVYFEGVSSIMA